MSTQTSCGTAATGSGQHNWPNALTIWKGLSADMKLDTMDFFWQAHEDQMIGGYAVSVLDAPGINIASFTGQDDAEHIAELHNTWLKNKRLEESRRAGIMPVE